MNAWNSPSETEEKRCPKCGSSLVHRKSPTGKKTRKNPEKYRCDVCRAHFDEPEIVHECCPECGSISLTEKSSNQNGRPREYEEDYRCRTCGEHFDEPDETTDATTRPSQIETRELKDDLRRVARELDRPPTTTEYEELGEFSAKPFYDRWDGSWYDIVDAVLPHDPLRDAG